jgi:hypothetical protein
MAMAAVFMGIPAFQPSLCKVYTQHYAPAGGLDSVLSIIFLHPIGGLLRIAG